MCELLARGNAAGGATGAPAARAEAIRMPDPVTDLPQPAEPPGHLPDLPGDGPHWRRTLYSLWLAMFFVFLEWTFAMTFLPIFLQDDIGLAFEQAEYWTGLMMALPSLAMFVAQPLWGTYADRIGRKPIVIVSVVCTSLLRALWYFAHSAWALLWLGVAAGVLGAGIVVGQAIVAAAAPRERMGEAMGTLQTSMTVGFLIGPVAGQFCASQIGARPTFLVQAVFAVVGALVVWLLVQERFERPHEPERVGFVKGVTRDLRPLVGHRRLQALWVMVFVVFFGFSSMWPILTYFVQYLGVPKDRVPAYSAYVMFATGSLMTLMAPLFGKLGDRIGHRRVLIGTSGACGVILVFHSLIKSYAQFFGLRVMATAPGAGIHPSTSALLARTMPRERYGGAYGVLASARALAGSVGPIVGGSLAAFVGIRWVFVWTGILTIVASMWAAGAVQEPAEPGQSE